jgi:hypothetical protein
MKRQDLTPCDGYRATYCPEDNKLRLYVGRVPRPEYEFLRAEGWTSTPKQSCDFVTTWTPGRYATAVQYAQIVEDEDMGPEERAADRAERFIGYREKRAEEAGERADAFEAGPNAHGYQNAQRAERAAARHDRLADKATDAWSKAEYWQRRTAGVISHALHKSDPDTRMGRIKVLEAELRKLEKEHAEASETWGRWCSARDEQDPEKQALKVRWLVNRETGLSYYKHPRPETVTNGYIQSRGGSLYDFLGMVERGYGTSDITPAEAIALWFAEHTDPETHARPWFDHTNLRLAYERQMLEAQGGRAGAVEIIPGGWLISGTPGYRRFREGTEERQIIKVNKSPVTGRVVSVQVRDNRPSSVNHWGNPYPEGVTKTLIHTVNIERAGPECYRPPTPEELEAFNAKEKAAKKAAKATAPPPVPLINPTDEDAERLQALINERHAAEWQRHHGKPTEHYKPKAATVERVTQAVYSANSSGSYARAETRTVHASGLLADPPSNMWSQRAQDYKKRIGPALCKLRFAGYDPVRVLVLTDKPQKPLPAAVWETLTTEGA